MNEATIDQLAAALLRGLQARHSQLCREDRSNAASHAAEAYLLELIGDAAKLNARIKAGGVK